MRGVWSFIIGGVFAALLFSYSNTNPVSTQRLALTEKVADVCMEEDASMLFDMINEVRMTNGVSPLSENAILAEHTTSVAEHLSKEYTLKDVRYLYDGHHGYCVAGRGDSLSDILQKWSSSDISAEKLFTSSKSNCWIACYKQDGIIYAAIELL